MRKMFRLYFEKQNQQEIFDSESKTNEVRSMILNSRTIVDSVYYVVQRVLTNDHYA